jgi:hypothetical protein
MSESILPLGKHIERDRETGDYAAFYDGELLGYRCTYEEAKTLADQYVFDLSRHGGAITTGELAAGAE